MFGYASVFEESEESPGVKGLGFMKGTVEKIKNPKSEIIKLPHINWNKIKLSEKSNFTLLDDDDEKNYFYFVHSFCVKIKEDKIFYATTEYYNTNFISSVQKENMYGLQFHPEKSGNEGLKILKKFIKI